MKRVLSIQLLSMLLAGALAAQDRAPASRPGRVPPELIGIVRSVSSVSRVWAFDEASPLAAHNWENFAKGGWRLEFSRPLQGDTGTGIQNEKNARRNTAEIILIPSKNVKDPQSIRSSLRWKISPQELHNVVCDLGDNGKWRIFARADVQTLDGLKNLFRCEGGDPMEKILAEALLVSDLEETTRRSVPLLIGKYGNAALPHLKRVLGRALAEEKMVDPIFYSIKALDTPEAAAELRRAIDSDYSSLAEKVYAVLGIEPFMRNGTELYLTMLSRHVYAESCIRALITLKQEKRLLPVLAVIERHPASYFELVTAIFTRTRLETGKVNIPENEIINRIRIVTARAGDIPGSPQMISIKSSESGYNQQLAEEEKRRVDPLIRAMLESKNTDCAIVCTLSLVLFSPQGADNNFSKDYVRRLNRYGWKILRQLPRDRVLAILYRLRDNCRNQDESHAFAALAVRLR